jgi:hypothetical protein
LDSLRQLEAKLNDLSLRIQAGIREWARESAAANDPTLTPGEQKKIRERAYWNEIRANQGHRAELFRELDDLCARYLEAIPEQRGLLRVMVADKHEVLTALNGYMYRALNRFQATADVKWLRLGLASIALEDLRIDYRDTLVALGEFYLTAVGSGLEPDQLLHEISALASSDQSPVGTSAKTFLNRFQNTAYFETSVKPRLRKE